MAVIRAAMAGGLCDIIHGYQFGKYKVYWQDAFTFEYDKAGLSRIIGISVQVLISTILIHSSCSGYICPGVYLSRKREKIKEKREKRKMPYLTHYDESYPTNPTSVFCGEKASTRLFT
ncbi:hypothetical protein L2E82_48831 [Cichorium intybus]|uniref:Uncharacterized protein n=1 Tax=Cichorium intybus TaxID=13427 RepID=A0ACB8YY30_CICIN|nr:hypothetical protein L2E82_48831 [Cichorium intybus]